MPIEIIWELDQKKRHTGRLLTILNIDPVWNSLSRIRQPGLSKTLLGGLLGALFLDSRSPRRNGDSDSLENLVLEPHLCKHIRPFNRPCQLSKHLPNTLLEDVRGFI